MRRRVAKRTLGVLLAAVMVFTLAACGKEKAADVPEKDTPDYIPVSYDYKAYSVGDNGERKLVETGTRNYDSQGRLLYAMTEEYVEENGTNRRTEDTFEYDELGRVVLARESVIREAGNPATESIVFERRYTYYKDTTVFTCVESLDNGDEDFSRLENTIGFDGAILGQKYTDPAGQTYVYADYDEAARKVTWYCWGEDSLVPNYTEFYDEQGRLIRREGMAYYDIFIPEYDTSKEFLYTGDSKICSEERTYDASGNLIGTYRYDDKGRIEKSEYESKANPGHPVERLSEWVGQDACPGVAVRRDRYYDLSSGKSELCWEGCFRKEPVVTGSEMFSVYSSAGLSKITFENGRYYKLAEYYHMTMIDGTKKVALETEFYENGAPKKVIKRNVSVMGSIASTSTIEYDEHGNPVRAQETYSDGNILSNREYENNYR